MMPADVVLRAGVALPAGLGPMVRADAQGIWFAAPAGAEPRDDASAPLCVRWDQVRELREVESVPSDLRADVPAWLAVGQDLWRARVRMERGDLAGAEPLLEAHLAAFAGQQGPTSAMVASGLLRCRVARMAQAASVRAYIAWLVSAGAEHDFRGSTALRPLIDPATRLPIDVPPLWVRSPALELVASAADGLVTQELRTRDAQAATIARLYALSAQVLLHSGVATSRPAMEDRPSDGAGAQFLWDVLAVTMGSDAQRAQARATLRAIVDGPDTPGWQVAWASVALGRSMLRDEDASSRRFGVALLASVPARFGRDYPALAGLALADIAHWLETNGRAADAARVRAELTRAYPNHPAGVAPGASAEVEGAP